MGAAQAEAEKQGTSHVAPATDGPRPTPSAGAPEPAALSNSPATPAVKAQLDYVLTYWKHYNPDYGVLDDNDCVNFTSQSLIARGWSEDDDWYSADDIADASSAWRSSTAMRNWLKTRPDLATALTDEQRDQVKVGDIVQFDWDRSGDRDHTGVVTRVKHTASGTKIYFAGHTDDSEYRDVDKAIHEDHPGAAVYYWSLAD
ncbi:amidase domain-containing protein [Rathayibacter sp. YIM 133350]|uniref:amidase domain-containing protein n=1 Tax=Rathayibacter sp. YIM 133350 TaxID=3131992 RepID=UPI00307F4A88